MQFRKFSNFTQSGFKMHDIHIICFMFMGNRNSAIIFMFCNVIFSQNASEALNLSHSGITFVLYVRFRKKIKSATKCTDFLGYLKL